MVATPAAAYTTNVWQAALAAPEHGTEVLEMVAVDNILLRYFINAEIADQRGFESRTGKAATKLNGYQRKVFRLGSLSAIQREIKKAQDSTVAAIAMSAAGTTSADLALPTPSYGVLTGDYGVVWGGMTYGLEEEIRGASGGKNFHEYFPLIRRDIAQGISVTLQTGFYSDGTANKIDGMDYWFKTTGTKWNSNDIAGTDTFLQGQSWTCTAAQFTMAKIREWIDLAMHGVISGTRSEGKKPNVCFCDTKTIRIMKGWLDDNHTVPLTPVLMSQADQAKNNDFVTLGSPKDYFMFDGVCFVPDRYIDDNMGANVGKGYMFNASDFEFIVHKKFGFNSVDAEKMGAGAATGAEAYTLPAYVYKKGLKQIVLCNLFNERPRNGGIWTRTA